MLKHQISFSHSLILNSCLALDKTSNPPPCLPVKICENVLKGVPFKQNSVFSYNNQNSCLLKLLSLSKFLHLQCVGIKSFALPTFDFTIGALFAPNFVLTFIVYVSSNPPHPFSIITVSIITFWISINSNFLIQISSIVPPHTPSGKYTSNNVRKCALIKFMY